jgi:hypothetical protein
MSTTKATRSARERLRAAVDAACVARGELLWTGGYRCGSRKYDDHDLLRKERRQQDVCSQTEQNVERAIVAYARAVRRGHRGPCKPARGVR